MYLLKTSGSTFFKASQQEDIYLDYTSDLFNAQTVWQAFDKMRFLLQPGSARNLAIEYLLERFEPGIVTSCRDLVIALK